MALPAVGLPERSKGEEVMIFCARARVGSNPTAGMGVSYLPGPPIPNLSQKSRNGEQAQILTGPSPEETTPHSIPLPYVRYPQISQDEKNESTSSPVLGRVSGHQQYLQLWHIWLARGEGVMTSPHRNVRVMHACMRFAPPFRVFPSESVSRVASSRL